MKNLTQSINVKDLPEVKTLYWVSDMPDEVLEIIKKNLIEYLVHDEKKTVASAESAWNDVLDSKIDDIDELVRVGVIKKGETIFFPVKYVSDLTPDKKNIVYRDLLPHPSEKNLDPYDIHEKMDELDSTLFSSLEPEIRNKVACYYE